MNTIVRVNNFIKATQTPRLQTELRCNDNALRPSSSVVVHFQDGPFVHCSLSPEFFSPASTIQDYWKFAHTGFNDTLYLSHCSFCSLVLYYFDDVILTNVSEFVCIDIIHHTGAKILKGRLYMTLALLRNNMLLLRSGINDIHFSLSVSVNKT